MGRGCVSRPCSRPARLLGEVLGEKPRRGARCLNFVDICRCGRDSSACLRLRGWSCTLPWRALAAVFLLPGGSGRARLKRSSSIRSLPHPVRQLSAGAGRRDRPPTHRSEGLGQGRTPFGERKQRHRSRRKSLSIPAKFRSVVPSSCRGPPALDTRVARPTCPGRSSCRGRCLPVGLRPAPLPSQPSPIRGQVGGARPPPPSLLPRERKTPREPPTLWVGMKPGWPPRCRA